MLSKPDITPRELEVLKLLNHHLANKEIAYHLGIGLDTVKDHVKSIRTKLEATNRGQAVDNARKLGLIAGIGVIKTKKHRLPQETTPLFGRHEEIQAIIEQLSQADTRLMTILGAGGIGKTRLAIKIAQLLFEQDSYPDGIYFMPLFALDNEHQLLHEMLDVLGLKPDNDKTIKTTILDFLANKSILLILDNYEHFLPNVAVVSDILESTQADILVTSRERLRLYGESSFMLEGLPYEKHAKQNDAFEMFVHRLTHMQKAPMPVDDTQIQRICELVEGFPLAIELAVSWGDILPLQSIADEIEKSLDILSSQMRNIPKRHQSIRAVFDYSLNFLSPKLRDIFLGLALCKGSFDLEAARAICHASPIDIRDLADKSLIYIENHRYSFHQLIRQYAQETRLLNPSLQRDSQDKFIGYYTDFLVTTAKHLHTHQELEALASLKLEADNIRYAIQLALDDENFTLIETCLYSLLMVYELQSQYANGSDLFRKILDKIDTTDEPILRAKVQIALCAMTLHTENFDFTKETLSDCLTVLYPSHPYWLGIGYRLLGELETNQGNPELAQVHLAESIEIYEEIQQTDSQILLALAERQLGLVLQDVGQVEDALQHYLRSQAIFSQLHYDRGIAMVLHRLGELAHQKGDYHEAKGCYLDSLSIHESLNDTDAIGRVYNKLGSLAYIHGNLDQAKEYFQVSFDISENLGAQYQLLVYANNLGVIAQDKEDYGQALTWFEKCLDISERINDEKHRGLALNNLGRLAYAQKQYDEALKLCLESLAIRRKTNYMQGLLYSLCDVGNAFVAVEQMDEAMQVYIEGLQLAITSQSVVRGLDLLLATAHIIYHNKPCIAQNITRLVITHVATQAKTRRLAEDFSTNSLVANASCPDEIDDWEQLASALIHDHYSGQSA